HLTLSSAVPPEPCRSANAKAAPGAEAPPGSKDTLATSNAPVRSMDTAAATRCFNSSSDVAAIDARCASERRNRRSSAPLGSLSSCAAASRARPGLLFAISRSFLTPASFNDDNFRGSKSSAIGIVGTFCSGLRDVSRQCRSYWYCALSARLVPARADELAVPHSARGGLYRCERALHASGECDPIP